MVKLSNELQERNAVVKEDYVKFRTEVETLNESISENNLQYQRMIQNPFTEVDAISDTIYLRKGLYDKVDNFKDRIRILR